MDDRQAFQGLRPPEDPVMSFWAFLLVSTGLGGAVLLWHTVSRTKLVSEVMLRQYSEMLADARRQKAQELEEQQRSAESSAETNEAADPAEPHSG